MKKLQLICITFLFAGFVSCNILGTKNHHPLHIQTDKTVYNINDDDSVKVTIINTSSEKIYYSTCFAKTIEVIADDKINQEIGTAVCECICAAELKPDESIPVWISSLSTEPFKSTIENQPTGKSVSYRIKYMLYYDEAFGDDPVPVKYSITNNFRLTGGGA